MGFSAVTREKPFFCALLGRGWGRGEDRMKGILVLEDGFALVGEAFGATGQQAGEVVFNTGMTGYQEILTDPSYCGQIVAMTYPLVGNYGTSPGFAESARPHVRGFVVGEHCGTPSHWGATGTLDGYLREHGIIGLARVDTRRLVRHLRERGTLLGVIVAPADTAQAQVWAQRAAPTRATAQVSEVTTRNPYRLAGPGPRVVVIDYGVKRSILHSLHTLGCEITVVPAGCPADAILGQRPAGVVLSNGPGDPREVPGAVETISALLGRIPIFGICLGHQLLGLALGGEVYKLKYGHRGANHPVRDLREGRVYITSQNHGFALCEDALPLAVEVTHRNLNDGSIEGLSHRKLRAFSVQYHPEAGPGPGDSGYLFQHFLKAVC